VRASGRRSVAAPAAGSIPSREYGGADVAVTCGWCGATAEELPLTWTTSTERGVQRYYCEKCSRENARAIEGKLDSEWW
jgi:hypothetical protein